jgi:hypothetical protein
MANVISQQNKLMSEAQSFERFGLLGYPAVN